MQNLQVLNGVTAVKKKRRLQTDYWQKYRALFPHTRNRVYLNHAALSPMHQRSINAVQDHLAERSMHNIEFWPALLDVKRDFKSLVGKMINGAEDRVAITDNTSMALNWLVQGLDWKPGDRILLNNYEFPSNVYPFLNVERLGVEIDYVSHENGRLCPEKILENLHPRTRILSISFVEFLNGFRNDLKALGQICRDRGIIFSVDAIQGMGALHIDVEEMKIDFLASGGQKWLMWPLGTAFFYTTADLFRQLRPMAAGWLSVQNPWDFFEYDLDFQPNSDRFEPGMINAAGVVGANASLEMFLEIGTRRIESRILRTTDYLIEQLLSTGFEVLTPLDRENRSGIVTFFHSQAEELAAYLGQRRVNVSLRNGMIRVSPHFYNTEDDIDHFMQHLLTFRERH